MLNPAQQEAVETLSGPLLVLAGAGTGKTRVVTYRTARLIKSGIKPDRILAVTFTNKAAREMQQRISDRLGKTVPSKPEISTFHSLCVRILRRRIHYLGYPNQFTIYDRGDQESVARQILRDFKISHGALGTSDFLSRISDWKSHGVGADHAMDHLSDAAKDYITAYAYRQYQEALKTLGAVDFDDLLLLTEELFQKYPEALAEESARFDHILVDEYQDTNLSQYRIIKGLALPHRNLCVVGDDDQAIYGWRGAEVTHILNFQKDWPDAKVIRLERNYRSTKPIITWANRVITFNLLRHAKLLKTDLAGEEPKVLQCKDGEKEAKTVVTLIKERINTDGRRPRDIAILFRTNEQPRQFELELRNQKVPYILIGGQSFFDRKEVKDILAYLKFFLRPQDDISLLRIVNTPGRGIGSTTIQKMRDRAGEKKCPLWDVISRDEEFVGSLDKKIAESLRGFSKMSILNASRLRKEFSVNDLTDFIDQINYKGEIDRNYESDEDRQTRWNSVGEVLDAAASFLKENPRGSMADFLDNTSLGGSDFSSGNEKKLDRNAVALMTYHAAKGLEFKEVFMVGLEEGILPHHQSVKAEDDGGSVDEERRLCYVGITRAQRRLTMTMALSRLKWGKNRPTVPSRFLYEATGKADNPHYEQIKNGEYNTTSPQTPPSKKGSKK